MKTKSILLSMVFALSLCSCGDKDKDLLEPVRVDPEKEELKPIEQETGNPDVTEDPETRHSYKPVVLNETQQAIHEKLQDFSWELFKEVYANREEGTNLMISPISLEVDLGMFLNGLKGTAQQEILKTMGLQDFTVEQVNDYFKTLMDGIEKADEAAIFKSANSFWYNQRYTANAGFLTNIQDSYFAKAEAVNFADPQTKDVINAWCAEKTNNRIDKMLDKTDDGDLFHLMNAVYFKASWKDQFEKQLTGKQPFIYADGKADMVDMMSDDFFALYVETDKYQLCLKPFVDDAFQMLFVMPKEGVAMTEILSDDLVKVLKDEEKAQYVTLMLHAPKFTSEYTEKKLFNYMQNINPSFALPSQDIKLLDNYNEEMLLSAMQKTFFLMDEEGAEAAAVTDIWGVATSIPDYTYMTLDHPFCYAILESNTFSPLFIGYYGE